MSTSQQRLAQVSSHLSSKSGKDRVLEKRQDDIVLESCMLISMKTNEMPRSSRSRFDQL